MTTIAWDGRTLAVDRQGNRGDMKFPITKMRKLPSGAALAWSGEHNVGLALMAWYEAGAKREDWPARQTPDRFTLLIVALPDGTCGHYEDSAEFIRCEAPFTAWGSGREFAVGAMAAGAGAVRAIEITSQHEINTGLGVDSASPYIDLNQATIEGLNTAAPTFGGLTEAEWCARSEATVPGLRRDRLPDYLGPIEIDG